MLTHIKEWQPGATRRSQRKIFAGSSSGAYDDIAAIGPAGISPDTGEDQTVHCNYMVSGKPGLDNQPAATRISVWRDCDTEWERLQERALDALSNGKLVLATRLWRRGWRIAQRRFDRRDPRYATSLANLGLVAHLAGHKGLACRCYGTALKRWQAVPGWIGTMTIARRGRSSLFHLQSETLHWNAYDRSLRIQAIQIARDVAAQLGAASRGQPPSLRISDRWPGEKPAVFDDLRKFLGAALLIAADA